MSAPQTPVGFLPNGDALIHVPASGTTATAPAPRADDGGAAFAAAVDAFGFAHTSVFLGGKRGASCEDERACVLALHAEAEAVAEAAGYARARAEALRDVDAAIEAVCALDPERTAVFGPWADGWTIATQAYANSAHMWSGRSPTAAILAAAAALAPAQEADDDR